MPDAFVSPYPLEDPRSDLLADDIERSIGFPAFLKVDCSGSTLGVARAGSRSGFAGALGEIRQPGVGLRWLAEAALTGVEVTCACLGNWSQEVRALPPVEIRPRQEAFFTYKAKYTAGASDELCPPVSLDPNAIEAVQELGVRCHRRLCCDGMSRTDMIVTEAGPQVLEVNTIPGLTRMSLLPKAAAGAGLDFGRLVDRLVELAMARVPASQVRVAS
jgi:D-alanine-D-alanine ligase